MDIVQQYVKSGFVVFPLEGKRPPEGYHWDKTPLDRNACRADFLGNYGVIVGRKALVIDIDCRNGKKGLISFDQLSKDLGLQKGWEQATYVVRTGSGGYHIYFSLPYEVKIKKTNSKYQDIEWLSRNMYVVGPESIHPDTGKPYAVLCGSPETISPLPARLLDALKAQEVEDLGEKPQEGFVDDDPENINRFIAFLAEMPVVNVGGQRNSAYIAACKGRDFGLSQTKNIEIINEYYNGVKLVPPIQPEEVEECVRNAYKYAQKQAGSLNISAMFKVTDVDEEQELSKKLMYDLDKKGNPLKTLNNAVNYLMVIPQIKGGFKYNVFSGFIEVDSLVPWYKERGTVGVTICDEDVMLLKYFLSVTVKIEFPITTLYEAITIVAHKRHYHPVVKYLKALKWDGVPRIDTWLIKYGHAMDNEYTRAIGRKTLCAAVKRVIHPGCKWDHVLVIEGEQGIGKSTACCVLAKNWYADIILDPHQKDSVAMMLGKWVIELSEMTALKWADANALRAFFTRSTDTARLSYARNAKDFPRQSIFIGTINPEHVGYLTDITGNRRYWVVKFNGPVDLVGLEHDSDQLWAEAMAVHDKEELFLRGIAHDLQVMETKARMPEDPMRKNVTRWVNQNPEVAETTTEDVLEYLGVPLKQVSRADQSRIAQALTEMGWIKEVRRTGTIFTTHYRKPKIEEVRNEMGGQTMEAFIQ